MINYGSHDINKKDINLVVHALKSKKITQGKFVVNFEESLKKKFNSKYACVVSNGSAALHLCCLAIDVRNSNVLLSSNTFLSEANAIIHAGGKPNFIDIDYDTGNISLEYLEKKIKQLKKKKEKISALIATDYAGLPCNWKHLKKLSRKYKFKLINDNCHAIGAKYNDQFDYATRYADLVVHSYHPVKNITTGEGGSILSNDKHYIEKIKILRNHGLIKAKKEKLKNITWPFNQIYVGFNFRISDIQCALGISQLKRLNIFLKKRTKIARNYDSFFKKYKSISLQKIQKGIKHAYHLYVIKINFKKRQKIELIRYFKKNKIMLQTHYYPIHHQPIYKKKLNFRENCKNSEKHFNNAISVPIYFNLKSKEQNKIINLFKNFFKRNNID